MPRTRSQVLLGATQGNLLPHILFFMPRVIPKKPLYFGFFQVLVLALERTVMARLVVHLALATPWDQLVGAGCTPPEATET